MRNVGFWDEAGKFGDATIQSAAGCSTDVLSSRDNVKT
jgi:hypothetical protein